MGALTTSFNVPDSYKPKSFWQKPEGGAGKFLTGAVIAALGAGLFVFWGVIVPFVLTTIQDTFWATVYLVGLFAILDVLIGIEPVGKQLHNIGKNIFQSIARAIAMCYTTIDPIGILNNTLDDMKKEFGTLVATIQRFSGANEKLLRAIKDAMAKINSLGAQANEAQREAVAAQDPLEKEKLTYEQQTLLENAGMEMQGLEQLKALQEETGKMLVTFQHWSLVADAKIKRTDNKVKFLTKQRAMIVDAKSTLAVGQRLLRGNPEQLKQFDMAIEYLEDDTARTLGEMREFTRYTDDLLTQDKIEKGANAELARAKFAEFSQKLLVSSNTPAAVDLLQIPGIPNSVPQPVPVPNSMGTGEDYNPFK